jgi:hypothetical protein
MIATSLPDARVQDLWYPTLMHYAGRRGFNVPHQRLDTDMIEYLRNNKIKYLALVDHNYNDMDSLVNERLCQYRRVTENNRVTIYDISEVSHHCKKQHLGSSRADEVLVAYGFEESIKGWEALENVEIYHDVSTSYKGNACLKITGFAQSGQWTFAQTKKIRLMPGKRYRLSGMMRIETISEYMSIFFKCALWKDYIFWVKNIDGHEYDLNRKGQWQKLTAEFIAPDEGELFLSLSVEKRPMEEEVKGTIHIDSIVLEMLK